MSDKLQLQVSNEMRLQRVARTLRSEVSRWGLVMAIVLTTACTTLSGPEYQRPDVADKKQWSQLEGRPLEVSEVVQPDWWTGFGDPQLNQLIDQSVTEGLDMKIAALRLDKAGIQLGRDRLAGTPKISAAPADALTRGKRDNSGAETQRDTELLGTSLSWELDIWGKIRKEKQAADASYRATEMDWRATQLTLVSTVAQTYFQIRQFDDQVRTQKNSQAQAERQLQIYTAQFGEGMIPETRILSQKAEINSLKTNLMDIERGRAEAELKLATLLGQTPGDLKIQKASLLDTLRLPEIPEVMPADILSRRPDILTAEYNLLKAHHLVGKARLARLPTFSLTGLAKTGTSLTSTLINSWSFGLAASWAGLFDRDVQIEVESSKADEAITVQEYRRTVLHAFEEVEISLLNLNTHQQQMKELQEQVGHLEVVRDVQQSQLSEGLISQLEVFETERGLLSAQQQQLATYQLLLTDTVTLYKALGGGWTMERVGSRFTPAPRPKAGT